MLRDGGVGVCVGGGGVGVTGDGGGVVTGVAVVVCVVVTGEVTATQSLSDVLPAGEVVPEGQDEQFVAPGDVE